MRAARCRCLLVVGQPAGFGAVGCFGVNLLVAGQAELVVPEIEGGHGDDEDEGGRWCELKEENGKRAQEEQRWSC